MFTGIIEELGKISKIMHKGSSSEVNVSCRTIMDDVKKGDSIAVNGTCLTVTDFGATWFRADVSSETLARTSLKRAVPGAVVNLERAIAMGGRFGGHIVQGHVDGMAQLVKVSAEGGFYTLSLSMPQELTKYVAEKGSIAVDGISLTVAQDLGWGITIAVIPHTYSNTNLYTLVPSDYVNIEVDVIARYTKKLLSGEKSDDRLRELLIDFD